PNGLAALVSMSGSSLTLVNPQTALSPTTGSTLVQIPMTLSGFSGSVGVTTAPVPVQSSVELVDDGAAVTGQRFLFDTGSQITVISTAEATALGLKLSSPNASITVKGVGGSRSVPTFILSELDVPLVGGGTLRFTNVPVAVLDLADGFD